MKRSKFTPVCVYDAMGVIRILRIVAEQDGEVLRLIVWDTTRDYVHSCEVGEGQVGPIGGRNRYIISQVNPTREAEGFKQQALMRGATPEAIRLLGLVTPVSKQEEITMAEKLKAKASGDKEALKAAAKAAPVVKGKAKPAVADTAEGDAKPAAKKKGNPEALEKARAARAERGSVNRKYKALVKAKDLDFREGSWTQYMAKVIVNNKDTDSAKAAHKESGEYAGKSLDFTWAEKKELISFS